jgi:prepilin-type N-terminal cleavage/methylation domain-containing protein
MGHTDFVCLCGRDDAMRQRNAFTLVELLIVVLILAALATIAVPRISESATNAKINACKANVKHLNSQLELWHLAKDAWPTQLSDLTSDTGYFPDGAPVCPYGTAYSYGKTTHHVSEHSHGTSTSKPPAASPIM